MNTVQNAISGPWFEIWFRWMTAMSWQVVVLVTALLLLSWALRRRSARLRYVLWSLVPVRLILPPTLALATGWAWWVLPAEEIPRTPDVIGTYTLFTTSQRPLPPDLDRAGFYTPAPAGLAHPDSLPITQPSVPPPASTQVAKWTWRMWLFVGWGVGVGVMLTRLLIGQRLVNGLVGRSVPIEDSALTQLLAHSRQRVGVRAPVRIHQSVDVETPLLIGVRRPAILVPPGIQQNLTPAELETVLIHELQHVRRHDALSSLLQAVLKAVYFFHPAVWLADRWLRRLREEACDEATIGVLAGNRRDYGTAILKLAEQSLRPVSPMAIGVVDSGSHITQRMRRILDPRLPTGRTLSWSALTVVLVAAATLLPAGPRQKITTQSSEEADAGVKPIEFRILPETLPEDNTLIRWIPIHNPSAKSINGNLHIKVKHTRQVQGRWEAAAWDVPEHALFASSSWHVVDCMVKESADPSTGWSITVTLDEKGAQAMEKLTSMHLDQHLAVIVNGQIRSAPIIKETLRGSFEIAGGYTKEQAQELAEVILLPATKPNASAKTETVASKSSTTTPAPPTAAEPQATTRGVVVDAEGKPAVGARVVVAMWNGKSQETTTDQDGRFELDATPKAIRGRLLRVFASEGQLQAAVALPWEEAEVGKSDIKLALAQARRIEFHIVDQNGLHVAGANCGVLSGFGDLGIMKSDEQGRAVFLLPTNIPVMNVYAWKGGVGFDYRAYTVSVERLSDKNAKVPELPEGPVKLTLDGVHPVKVRLQEPDGQPIVGGSVYPWLLRKPDQPEDLNLSYLVAQFSTTSDSQGELVFDWIPQWQSQNLQLWPSSNDHVRQRGQYDPKTGDGRVTITLDRLVPLRGKATHADGSPAVGISIRAKGEGYEFDDFDGGTTTNENGQYELKVAPNMIYLVVAGGPKLAAAPRTGFAVWPKQPIENIDFVMRPATRLHGQITQGPDKQPVKDFRVYSYQYGIDGLSLPEIKLPNPKDENKWVCPMIVHHAMTDETGHYELFVGSGKFDIRGPSQNSIEKFEIKEEPQREFNFEAPRPESGPLQGLVKTADNVPVANAKVSNVYRHNTSHRSFEAVTNEQGAFNVTRQLHRTVIHAVSEDGKLAGLVEIDEDAPSTEITVGPPASATGRLLDEDGKPLADQEITYGVRVHIGDDNAPFRDCFGGATTTDSDGKFEIKSLMVGQTYHVTWVTYTGPQKNHYRGRRVTDHTPKSVDPVDLGDLKQAPEWKPPTLADQINEAFDIKGKRGSPTERFELAKRRAALSDQRVMILFGTPNHKPIEQLMQLRFEDNDVGTALNPFRIVAINTTGEKLPAAQALAQLFGVSLSASDAACSVHVIEPDGKRIVSADEQSISESGQISRGKLMALLAAHTITALNAETILSNALAQAKKENKRIFLQETATWCGPCWLLSDYLDKHRTTWEKDFIWVKMDHRWEHCDTVMESLRKGAQSGIPWIAILDSDGKPLVTSNTAKGENIGFPSDDAGRQHFRSMLEKTAVRLTPDEITHLMSGLEEK